MNDLLSSLKTLLSNQFGATFKKYLIAPANLSMLPNKSMPLLVISPIQTIVNNSGTLKDRDTYTVQVKIVDDVKKYIDNIEGAWEQSDSLVQHVDWAEKRTNRKIDANTIVGVIRDNIAGNNKYLFNEDVTVEYPDEVSGGTTLITTITFTAQDRTTR